MIRDPIARFESFYYFSRFGNNLGGGGHAKLTDERRAESIDECVSKRRPECKNPWWQIVPYICGHHPACSKRSQEAVDIAKVRKKFFFVEIQRPISKLDHLPFFNGNFSEVFINVGDSCW